jgi:phosphatidylglycerol---prolipoprotein diacylglyceryl transferase
MFPELFKIPYLDFPVNTYGLLLAISFLVGMYVMAKQAERDGLNVNRVYDLGLWVLGSALIGSKLLMVVTEWENYRDNLKGLFSLDFLRSAGVFYGGFLGALIASVIVMRIYKLDWWRTADAFAPGIIIGQAIGRLGCFSAGCCWGKPTDGICGVHFSERGHELTSVPTKVSDLTDLAQRGFWEQKLGDLSAPLHLHPVQLYEVGAAILIFVILLVMARKRKFHGQIVLAYAMLYAVARFMIEFWRDDPRGGLLALSTSQFIAAVIFVGSLIAYIYRAKNLALAEART